MFPDRIKPRKEKQGILQINVRTKLMRFIQYLEYSTRINQAKLIKLRHTPHHITPTLNLKHLAWAMVCIYVCCWLLPVPSGSLHLITQMIDYSFFLVKRWLIIQWMRYVRTNASTIRTYATPWSIAVPAKIHLNNSLSNPHNFSIPFQIKTPKRNANVGHAYIRIV